MDYQKARPREGGDTEEVEEWISEFVVVGNPSRSVIRPSNNWYSLSKIDKTVETTQKKILVNVEFIILHNNTSYYSTMEWI